MHLYFILWSKGLSIWFAWLFPFLPLTRLAEGFYSWREAFRYLFIKPSPLHRLFFLCFSILSSDCSFSLWGGWWQWAPSFMFFFKRQRGSLLKKWCLSGRPTGSRKNSLRIPTRMLSSQQRQILNHDRWLKSLFFNKRTYFFKYFVLVSPGEFVYDALVPVITKLFESLLLL